MSFSVREAVEMVKRVSGIDFEVEIAPRRTDLATIVGHALTWEQTLRGRALMDRALKS
jgi:UDP-glucose 4-epimerase